MSLCKSLAQDLLLSQLYNLYKHVHDFVYDSGICVSTVLSRNVRTSFHTQCFIGALLVSPYPVYILSLCYVYCYNNNNYCHIKPYCQYS